MMTTDPPPAPLELLVPRGTTVVHIGAPKTGTTALQNAAHRLRPRLAECGVVYPGRTLNHQRALSVLIGRPADAWGGTLPPERWWHDMRAQIDAATSDRILLSFELVCQADIDGARRVAAEIGPDIHVVLALRNFGDLLPSMWQQTVKMGSTKSLDQFLRESLADPTAVSIPGSDAFHRSDGRWLIDRWCEAIGPERITVVVVGPDRPGLLFDAFESLLGLPSGLLSQAPGDGLRSNRGMSAVEAELFRSINRSVLADWRTDKRYQRQLVWMGAIDRALSSRVVPEGEQRVRLLDSAAPAARRAGELLAESVRSSGVRVVGDLEALSRPVATMGSNQLVAPESVPFDLARESLLGMYARAVGAESTNSGPVPVPAPRPLQHPASSSDRGATSSGADTPRPIPSASGSRPAPGRLRRLLGRSSTIRHA